jgi:hypothetical protein
LAACFSTPPKNTLAPWIDPRLITSLDHIDGAQMQHIPNANSPDGPLPDVSDSSALDEKAGNLPGSEKVTSFGQTATDALRSTTDYVRQTDLQGMMKDLLQLVKNNPGPALVSAAVLGFLVARTLSRD